MSTWKPMQGGSGSIPDEFFQMALSERKRKAARDVTGFVKVSGAKSHAFFLKKKATETDGLFALKLSSIARMA